MDSEGLGLLTQSTVLDKVDFNVTAVAASDTKLILGDDKGNLHKFDLLTDGTARFDKRSTISKKQIDQLEFIPESNIVLVLNENNLFFVSPELDLLNSVMKQGIGKFVTNKQPGRETEIALLYVKKKIAFFRLNLVEVALESLNEDEFVYIGTLPEHVEFYGDKLGYLGAKKFFCLNMHDGSVKKNEFEGEAAVNIEHNWAIFNSGIGVFFNDKSEPLNQTTLSYPPKKILAARHFKGFIALAFDTEIRLFDGKSSEQIETFACSGTLKKIGGRSRLFCSIKKTTGYSLLEIKELDFQTQIEKLLENENYEEALKVLNSNVPSEDPNKPTEIEKLFLMAGLIKIRKGDYKGASELILLTNYNPIEILLLVGKEIFVKIEDPVLKETFENTTVDIKRDKELLKMVYTLLTRKLQLMREKVRKKEDKYKNASFLDSRRYFFNVPSELTYYSIFKLLYSSILKIAVLLEKDIQVFRELITYAHFDVSKEEMENFFQSHQGKHAKFAEAVLFQHCQERASALKIWSAVVEDEDKAESEMAAKVSCKIIKESGSAKLFQDFAKPLLRRFPEMVFELFKSTGIVKVEFFFNNILKSSEIEGKIPSLSEQFLEFYTEQGCDNNKYFSQLAEIYIDAMLVSQSDKTKMEEYKLKLVDLIKSRSGLNNYHLLNKLKTFGMVEVEIYLLKNLDKHQEALSLLVDKVVGEKSGFEPLEQFCCECSDGARDILISTLFEKYKEVNKKLLSSDSEEQRQLLSNTEITLEKLIFKSLDTYIEQDLVDPIKIIENIPEEWSVTNQNLFEFILTLIKSSSLKRNKFKISASLSSVTLLNNEMEVAAQRNKGLLVDNESTCEFCSKKIGSSGCVMFPTGSVFHSKCVSNPYICPVTGRDFKQDI